MTIIKPLCCQKLSGILLFFGLLQVAVSNFKGHQPALGSGILG
jgi:hypothetical protein